MPALDVKAPLVRLGTFAFTSDNEGRPISAEGWLASRAAERDQVAQRSVSQGLPGYHAGHLIPARFGGPGSASNLVPMPGPVNTSYVKAVENAIGRYLRFGPVFLRITVSYQGAGPVPSTVRHEMFRQARSGGITPIPGGEVITTVAQCPSQRMSRAADPYTGKLITPKEFLDVESNKGRGAGLLH